MTRILAILFVALVSSLSAFSQITLVQFATGTSDPVDIKNCGDERLFVVEQRGYIYIFDTAGVKLPTAFMNIQPRTRFGSEQGLLGLAFPKDYQENGYFYVNYTAQTAGRTRISRFRVSSSDPNIADTSSEEILMEIHQPFTNHNGGHIAFGADGYLYIGMGDGGSGGDPGNRSQNPDSLLGKMLRIEVDHTYSGYKIPPSNPFVCNPNPGREEIWALGVRNPWRFSFDRCTGDLWIGDVGQNAQEEINFQSANARTGGNYGWRCYEGTAVYSLVGGCGPQSSYIDPVIIHSHPSVCSVTGGYVYRGSRYNDMYGKYFYTDYCTPTMYTLESDGMGGFTQVNLGTLLGSSYSTFGEDMWGDLYIAGLSSGTIYKFRSSDCTPVASINCDVDTLKDCGYGFAKLSVPAGRGFTYAWYYNGNLLAEDSSVIVVNTSGTYSVEVTNPGTACMNADTIEVLMGSPLNLSFSGLDTLYCINDQPVVLQPSIPGGHFSGSGVDCIFFNPSLVQDGMHVISYTYTTDDGCFYKVSQDVRVDLCVGLSELNRLRNVSIYPNPNNGTFNLSISSESKKNITIEITTILGKVLHSEIVTINGGENSILPNYKIANAGLYFVKLTDGTSTSVHRVRVD